MTTTFQNFAKDITDRSGGKWKRVNHRELRRRTRRRGVDFEGNPDPAEAGDEAPPEELEGDDPLAGDPELGETYPEETETASEEEMPEI